MSRHVAGIQKRSLKFHDIVLTFRHVADTARLVLYSTHIWDDKEEENMPLTPANYTILGREKKKEKEKKTTHGSCKSRKNSSWESLIDLT